MKAIEDPWDNPSLWDEILYKVKYWLTKLERLLI